MIKKTVRLFPIVMAVIIIVTAAAVTATGAGDGEVSIPDDTLITYGNLEAIKEQLKAEIIAELLQSGGIESAGGSEYVNLVLKRGDIITLGVGCEVICRSEGACVISASCDSGDGVIDMASGNELFSGMPLEYGHIYYGGSGSAKKCIVITGEQVMLTLRGEYAQS